MHNALYYVFCCLKNAFVAVAVCAVATTIFVLLRWYQPLLIVAAISLLHVGGIAGRVVAFWDSKRYLHLAWVWWTLIAIHLSLFVVTLFVVF